MQHFKSQSGFSLIEVMLCVVMLSVGLVAVNRTLLTSLGAMSFAVMRAEADRVTADKVWEIQSNARNRNQPPASSESGTLLGSEKTFEYDLKSAATGNGRLREVRLAVHWKNSGKEQGLTRAFYVLLPNVPKK